MRILHTSDWHLGRTFGPVSLLDDQAAFVDWLVEVVTAESVDLVVVAGDIYDRTVPPNDAVRLFRTALRRLRDAGARVAAITGNHDGADRVDAYNDLLDSSGVLLRGGYSKVGEVLPLQFADGPLDLVLVPFLDPQAAPVDMPLADGPGDDPFQRRVARTHQTVLRAAVEAARAHVSAPRSLAVAHAFVRDCATSDSERQLTVGGTGTVDAALFQGFSYTALGHLHQPQQVGGSQVVRYSGTPLAMSFSETHRKSVTMVDLHADGTSEVRTVTVPVGRPVLTVRGTMDELLRREPSAAKRGSFVRAVVTDRGVVLDAKRRLSAVYPHVVEILLEPPLVLDGQHGVVADQRSHSATQIAEMFWTDTLGRDPTADERAVLHDALEQAHTQVV